MREIFFASDHHFDHANIITYCARPFSCTEEMNEVLIDNHNKYVKPGDIVYLLGDLSFDIKGVKEILRVLNGIKYFLPGNHDKFKVTDLHINLLRSIHDTTIENIPVTFCHYPMLSWNKSFHGAFHLHGHTHGTIPFNPNVRRLDVGVDCHNYSPISWEVIKEKLSNVPTPKELRKLAQENDATNSK